MSSQQSAFQRLEYRVPLSAGYIEVQAREILISFVHMHRAFAYRIKPEELCGDRVRRLVKVNPIAYLLGGIAALIAITPFFELFQRHSVSMLSLLALLLAFGLFVVTYYYRTITWYYLRANNVHSSPLIFPCPQHLTDECEAILDQIINRTREMESAKLDNRAHQS